MVLSFTASHFVFNSSRPLQFFFLFGSWSGMGSPRKNIWASCDKHTPVGGDCSEVGLPWQLGDKEPNCQRRRCGFNPYVGKIPWRRKWDPTPVFLPGKSHGQRNPVGFSPWGHKEWDMTYWFFCRSLAGIFYSTLVSGFQKNNNNKNPRSFKDCKGLTLGSHIATLSSPSTDQSKPKAGPNSTGREIDSNSWWEEQQSHFAKGHVAWEGFSCFIGE